MKRPTLISLFSGAGGLDYGFEAAGFDVGACVEMERDACETMRRSRPSWHVIERSIFDVSTDAILMASAAGVGDVDLLVGGPPCQPFSKAGYWSQGDARRLEDPRASTLGAYLRVLEEAQPKAFLLENVEGLAYAGKNEGLLLLLEGIKRINQRAGSRYDPVILNINAADYGVPQHRQRVFVVAARDGTRFACPAPTHFDSTTSADKALSWLQPYRTAWDAIGDVKVARSEDLKVRGKWADLLPSIPEGENYLYHTEKGGGRPLFGWRRRYWTFLLKLAKARPSWTIQAQPGPAVGPFHWKNRYLSIEELCRLQTFPRDVQIEGSRVSAHRQIGNAVPSLLGEVLGRAIGSQLLGLPVSTGELTLLTPRLGPAPAKEPATDVPESFRAMEGQHSPHPGTGKGFRARLRTPEAVPA